MSDAARAAHRDDRDRGRFGVLLERDPRTRDARSRCGRARAAPPPDPPIARPRRRPRRRERRRSTIGASVAPRYADAMARIRVALAQLNTVVGDLDGNASRVLDALRRSRGRRAADLVVFPELADHRYPPEDLAAEARLRRRQPRRRSKDRRAHRPMRGGRRLRRRGPRPVQRGRGLRGRRGRTASTASGSSRTTRCSTSSATSSPGDEPLQLFVIAGVKVGVSICEDAWSPTVRSPRRPPAAPSSSST